MIQDPAFPASTRKLFSFPRSSVGMHTLWELSVFATTPWSPPTPGKKALLAQGPLASPKGGLGCQPASPVPSMLGVFRGRSNGPSLARLDLNRRPCRFTPQPPARLGWLQGIGENSDSTENYQVGTPGLQTAESAGVNGGDFHGRKSRSAGTRMCRQTDPTEPRASKEPRQRLSEGCPLGSIRVFGQAKTLVPGCGPGRPTG